VRERYVLRARRRNSSRKHLFEPRELMGISNMGRAREEFEEKQERGKGRVAD